MFWAVHLVRVCVCVCLYPPRIFSVVFFLEAASHPSTIHEEGICDQVSDGSGCGTIVWYMRSVSDGGGFGTIFFFVSAHRPRLL